MFPLSILTYVKIIAAAVILSAAWYSGYHFESTRFEAYRLEQTRLVQEAEQKHQALADQIRTEKDAQIQTINTQLLAAVSELRERPSRAQDAANGQDGTGRALSAEDAQFLVGEAARADLLRTNLAACYQQYDSLSK
jgi:hypothetical protein